MELEELKKKSNVKVLLRGESGRGKTFTACKTALELLDDGKSVLYVDTEDEGSDTIVKLVEEGDFDEDVVEGLEYVRVDSYESMKSAIQSVSDFDLVVFDTLDHKHTYVLKAVTDERLKAEADWNEYPVIYSEEKEFMDDLRNTGTNVLATVDPESGKEDKPKGAQVNIGGYFSVVVSLYRSGDEWTHKIDNWVGRPDLIGGSIDNVELWEAISQEIEERT